MNKPASELIALADERAELMAKNAAATSWGAAVGARHERIKEIDGLLAANHGKPDGAVREALRAICKAGNELGCSCADRNYQWFDQSCKELMADAFRKMLADEAALHSPKPAETSPGDVVAMKEALKPFARAAKQIPPHLPDDLWTTCSSYDWDMPEADFDRMKADGIPLLSRKMSLSLWIDGHPLSDFRRAAEVYAAIGRIEAEAKSQEPEAVAWQYQRADGEWCDCWKPNEIELKVAAKRFRALYTHPTTKPEAPAVGVDAEAIDAVARIIDPTAWKLQDGYWMEQAHAYEAISKATAIAALIAGER